VVQQRESEARMNALLEQEAKSNNSRSENSGESSVLSPDVQVDGASSRDPSSPFTSAVDGSGSADSEAVRSGSGNQETSRYHLTASKHPPALNIDNSPNALTSGSTPSGGLSPGAPPSASMSPRSQPPSSPKEKLPWRERMKNMTYSFAKQAARLGNKALPTKVSAEENLKYVSMLSDVLHSALSFESLLESHKEHEVIIQLLLMCIKFFRDVLANVVLQDLNTALQLSYKTFQPSISELSP